jgi:acyl-CoA synthetase (AMP-forming)/AMP-acid ligase II
VPRPPASIVDICRDHAQQRSDRIAYRFSDGQKILATLSFADLDRAARTVAVFLQSRCRAGDRVLLLMESGADFVRSFFGCLYAGVIAVPLNLPVGTRRLAKVCAVAENAGARLMLADATTLKAMPSDDLAFDCVDVALALEHGAGTEGFRDLSISPLAPAFLQYTSGSTGAPKGVIVSHGNLLANQAMIRDSCWHGDDTIFVGWLPLFHDMGLVGNVLQPAYLGIPSILMPPSAFVRRPLRWLQLISEYRATTSGGPNFAYETCVRRLADADLDALDLRSWRIAFNGSEPVRARTLQAFARKFERVGFSSKAFYPVYGLAEATLMVSAPDPGTPTRVRCVPAAALEQGSVPPQDSDASESGQLRELVSCGTARSQVVRIVHPETCSRLGQREVGEIWITGPNVTQGYWNNPTLSEQTFGARTLQGEGPFLRTGDLGFLESGQLYVTGRLKDLLIVNGKNHYPQDIEHTVAHCAEAFVGRPGAAFLLPEEGQESLAVVQEVSKSFLGRQGDGHKASAVRELKARIRDTVVREHGLALKHVLLVPQGSLPMTTSGKIQRSYAQKLLLDQQFQEIWAPPLSAPPP